MTHIAFAADENFVPQLLVASASAVCASERTPIAIHVLDCGMASESWRKYESRVRGIASGYGVAMDLFRHPVNMDMFSGLQTWTNGTLATWSRLLIPQILCDVPYCIYSDCDVLFVADGAGMIEELVASGCAIAGHRNPLGGSCMDARWSKMVGVPFRADEFIYAGLVAMDLNWMRENGSVDAFWEFIRRYRRIDTGDQAVLNFVLDGNKALLSDGWGVFTHECYSRHDPIKAIHFSGGWPWKTPQCAYDALSVRLSSAAVALWNFFQTETVGLAAFNPGKARFRHRAVAAAALATCRVLSALRLEPRPLANLIDQVRRFGGSTEEIERAMHTLASRTRKAGKSEAWKGVP